ncbi:MAG: hypothetical protein GY719_09255 [bacterium]|nr:hypothetical protein [bacterium]
MTTTSRHAFGWLIALCLSAPLPAGAEDDVVFVSRQTSLYILSDQQLLANDGAACASILGHSRPSRGTLSRGDSAFLYRPSAAFAAAGADGFWYRNACGEVTGVSLVADLRGELVVVDPAVWSGSGDVGWTCSPTSGCRVAATYQAGVETWVEVPAPPLGHGSAHTGGGATTLTLDGGDGPGSLLAALQPGDEVPLFAAVGEAGEPVFEAVLRQGAAGPEILARGRQGAAPGVPAWLVSPPLPLPPGVQPVGLHIWQSPAAGLSAGGAMLEVAGEVAAVPALDNHLLHLARWRFGARTPAAAGSFTLGEVELWTSDQPPWYPMEFWDDFHHGVLAETWSGVTNPGYLELRGSAPPSGRLEVTVPGDSSPVFVSRELAGGALRHFRARFGLLASGACQASLPAAPELLTVLAAMAADGLRGFTVGIRRDPEDPGGHQICAVATLDDATEVIPACGSLPEAAEVEIRAWAAGEQADGYLELLVGGEHVAELEGLDNSLARIEQLFLGALWIPWGSAGMLCFDGVELSG